MLSGLPRLGERYSIRLDDRDVIGRFNCLAAALGDDQRSWEPDTGVPLHERRLKVGTLLKKARPDGRFWPPGRAQSEAASELFKLFEDLGAVETDRAVATSNTVMPGRFLAVFSAAADINSKWSHVSFRDAKSESWVSKFGALEMIEHPALDQIERGIYGSAYWFFHLPDFSRVHSMLRDQASNLGPATGLSS